VIPPPIYNCLFICDLEIAIIPIILLTIWQAYYPGIYQFTRFY